MNGKGCMIGERQMLHLPILRSAGHPGAVVFPVGLKDERRSCYLTVFGILQGKKTSCTLPYLREEES